MQQVTTINGLKSCHEKIRTVIPDNFLKICEIGGICGFNFGIGLKVRYRQAVSVVSASFLLAPALLLV